MSSFSFNTNILNVNWENNVSCVKYQSWTDRDRQLVYFTANAFWKSKKKKIKKEPKSKTLKTWMRFEKAKRKRKKRTQIKDIENLTNSFHNISIPSTHCYLRSDTWNKSFEIQTRVLFLPHLEIYCKQRFEGNYLISYLPR